MRSKPSCKDQPAELDRLKKAGLYRRYAIVDEQMQHEAAEKINVAMGTISGTMTSAQARTASGQSA